MIMVNGAGSARSRHRRVRSSLTRALSAVAALVLCGGMAIVPGAVSAQTASASAPVTTSSGASGPAGAGYRDAAAMVPQAPAASAASAPERSAAVSTTENVGYREAASDGGVYSFGTTAEGSLRGRSLNKPIVGMASTPDGGGYWLVASDGGIFSFGDAVFHGSAGSIRLNKPIVGMASTPDGGGYWLVASDGGIFSFGDAVFHGSAGSYGLNRSIIAMAATPSGGGYWLIAADGGLFTFGNAPFFGSTGSDSAPAPIVAAATGLYSQTGYDISWPQCATAGSSATVELPQATGLSVVGATYGRIGPVASAGELYGPNPCLRAEAAWAGPDMQTYLVADPIDASDGPLSATTEGPKSCSTEGADTTACGYNWGWANALQSVAMVHADGLHPTYWWLDVETDEGWSSADAAVNAQIIQGMVDALRSQGLVAGIYCTNYQWQVITGGYQIPGIPVWIAGAGNIFSGTYSAAAFCSESRYDFAGGVPWDVQYGYVGSGYDGPYSGFDQDYACPG